MRVLVTGSTGFAGRAMVRHLLSLEGDLEVTGFYRSTKPPKAGGCTYRKVDLADGGAAREAVKGADPEVVLHLAGRNHGPLPDLLEGNVTVTGNLLEAAASLGHPVRVLVTGSSAEYGNAGPGPIPESAPLRPVGSYGVTKVAAELLALAYHRGRNLPVAVVRPFNLVGPSQSEDYVCGKVVHQVAEVEAGKRDEITLAEVTSRRDFVDVRDMVAACWSLAAGPEFATRCAGKAFNIGSGVDHSVADVLELIRKITGKRYPVALPSEEPRVLVPTQRSDNTLITATCGWRPTIPLAQSLREMLVYEREQVR